jgi:hypothetical protein
LANVVAEKSRLKFFDLKICFSTYFFNQKDIRNLGEPIYDLKKTTTKTETNLK